MQRSCDVGQTMGDGVNFGRLPDGLGSLEAALGLDEVRGEDSVNERGFAQTRLACEQKRASLRGERGTRHDNDAYQQPWR